MNKYLTTLIFLLVSLYSYGQVGFYDWNGQHTLRINANGSLGVNLESLAPASFQNSNATLPFIRQAGLWIIARDIDGNYHTATHFQNKVGAYDFWAGPIDTLTGQTSEDPKWNDVWTVSKTEIENHRTNFASPEYIIPESIVKWPAMGSDGFATYLAPFIDQDNNGIYNPENGDYPDIKGVASTYCIFNDLKSEHNASFGQEIGIEVTLLASRLEEESSAIYLEYFVINRRPTRYDDIKVGFFLNAECGNRFDNYAGSFSEFPQSIFVYNGDELDEGFFGNDRPYVYATFQNENLDNTLAFNDGDKINGKPVQTKDFINYSNSRWKDSSFLTVGGDGTIGTLRTRYIFDQSDPNSNLFWTEDQQPNSLGARNIVGFTQKKDFERNEFIKFNILLGVGTSKNDNITEQIKSDASFNDRIYRQSSSIKYLYPRTQVYPNPTTGEFNVTCNYLIKDIIIYNSIGQLVFYQKNVNDVASSCNILQKKGVYYITLNTTEGSVSEKLIIIE